MNKPKLKELSPLAKAEKRIEDWLSKTDQPLNLQGLGLRELPERVRSLTKLEELDIRGNHILRLPDWLQDLRALKTLHWWKNGPITLPDWLPVLPNLEFLNIGDDAGIQGISIIGALRLRRLLMEGMSLRELPEFLRGASQLRILTLPDNDLSSLPNWVGNLTELEDLDLSGNSITALSAPFFKLTNLQSLNLRSNQITTLPAPHFAPSKLEKLYLDNNPLTEIPAELVRSHDAQRILAYARKLGAGEGKQPLMEAKMILVGRGAVGKTTLVHQLIHGRFKQKHKTKGILVSEWEVPCPDGLVTAHVWDFGGQEIMHGTHQFFLTERSLYVLVLAGREDKEDEDAEYWLKMIGAFGGDAPVIVVLNKIKEHHFEVDEEALQEKYPNIVGFVETDCKHGQAVNGKGTKPAKDAIGLPNLRKLIHHQIARMDSVRTSFPSAWRRIKDLLPGRAKNFISYDDFRVVCAELGEKNKGDQDDLAAILHILGVALNYRDDPRLRETSVLNRDWVTGGIYSLLNDSTIAKRRGVIRHPDLARVLNKDDYPVDKHDFLLRLMQKFELCFPLDDDGREYLIPQLLTKKGPKLGKEFSIQSCYCFEYHYPGLLPEGLLPRFIVRAYARIVDELRWRTGVVLGWIDARALIRADKDRRQVVIRVNGSDAGRIELLALIRRHFDEIHKNFNRLDPLEIVRVPQIPNLALEYVELEVLAKAGHKVLPKIIGNGVVEVDILRVLDAFEAPGYRRHPKERGVADLDPDTPVKRKGHRAKEVQ